MEALTAMDATCSHPTCGQPTMMRCYACGDLYCAAHLTSEIVYSRGIGRILVTLCRGCLLRHRQQSA
jgi:hypothetical protein